MAWNRPSAAPKPQPKKTPNALKGALAGVVVVAVLAGALCWILSGDSGKVEKAEKKPTMIKEVTPAKAPKEKPAAAPKEKPAPENPKEIDERFFDPDGKPRAECYRDEQGVLRYKNGNARAYDPKRPAKEIRLLQADEKPLPFEFASEREIARFVVIPLGETMIGEREYDDAFVADFRKSLKVPIIVTKDDDEEDAELKRSMIEIKKDILDRERAGEDIRDILEENRKEYQRMSQFKRDLEHELSDLTEHEDMTEKDFDDFITAANKMLEDKGLKPFESTGFLKMNLRHNIRARRNAQQ